MILKNICRNIFFLTVLPLCLYAKEEAKIDLKEIKHPVKPMLWKIEGKGLKVPSYLFGTIHIGDPRVTNLNPLAQQAFDRASAVYTEVELSPEKQLEAMPIMMRKGDKSLEELIGEDMFAALDAELKAINPALDIAPFEKMQIGLIAFMLPQLEDQMKGKMPLDLQLWQRAEKEGKTTGALETMKGQLGQFKKFTLGEQKQLLKVTLEMMKTAREKKIRLHDKLINFYLLGNADGVLKEIDNTSYMGANIDSALVKKVVRLLLNERNKGMATSIQKALSAPDAKSHFFAAGTAHYLGENSVNDLLKKAGYTVTRVTK